MSNFIFYGRFMLCGSEAENEILKEAVKYFPINEPLKRTKNFRKIAIYTATPRYGIVIYPKIRKKNNIILLPNNNFPKESDPTERLFRFLVFTILHECAHIRGIADEHKADELAYKWFNAHLHRQNLDALQFDPKEKSETEDFMSARDFVVVSRNGDSNEHISGRIGSDLVKQFINKSETEGGISRTLRRLVEDYICNGLSASG